MGLNKKSVDDINAKGKRVLVRCDFNVPLDAERNITDETRIDGALPTIQYLIDNGAKVILCSHMGKPKGEPKPELSLAPVAKALSEKLGKEVVFAADDNVVGDNAKAAMMTRGITEMSRLGIAMGAKPETFSGLTGLGDLIVTCTSMHSRNRRMGILVGSGKDAKTALEQVGMTVEGYYACQIAYTLKDEYNVEMPIVTAVYDILFNNKNAYDVAIGLMQRPGTSEN